MVWAALAVAAAAGWWVTGRPPFSTSALAGMLVLAGLVVGVTVSQRAPGDARRVHDRPANTWVWVAVIAAIALWELLALFGHPRDAHPTLSSILDPLEQYHLLRWILFDIWLLAGWYLAA